MNTFFFSCYGFPSLLNSMNPLSLYNIIERKKKKDKLHNKLNKGRSFFFVYKMPSCFMQFEYIFIIKIEMEITSHNHLGAYLFLSENK